MPALLLLICILLMLAHIIRHAAAAHADEELMPRYATIRFAISPIRRHFAVLMPLPSSLLIFSPLPLRHAADARFHYAITTLMPALRYAADASIFFDDDASAAIHALRYLTYAAIVYDMICRAYALCRVITLRLLPPP